MFSLEIIALLVLIAVVFALAYICWQLMQLGDRLRLVKRVERILEDKVSETLFRLEQDNRRQDSAKLDNLIAHLGLETYKQPQQILFKKKHE